MWVVAMLRLHAYQPPYIIKSIQQCAHMHVHVQQRVNRETRFALKFIENNNGPEADFVQYSHVAFRIP